MYVLNMSVFFSVFLFFFFFLEQKESILTPSVQKVGNSNIG